jgi:hypothetical protein
VTLRAKTADSPAFIPGILVAIPHEFFRHVAGAAGVNNKRAFTLPPVGEYLIDLPIGFQGSAQ